MPSCFSRWLGGAKYVPVCVSLKTINKMRNTILNNSHMIIQCMFIACFKVCPSAYRVKRPVLPKLNPCHGNPGSFASASLSMLYQARTCLAKQVTREPEY